MALEGLLAWVKFHLKILQRFGYRLCARTIIAETLTAAARTWRTEEMSLWLRLKTVLRSKLLVSNMSIRLGA